MPSLAYSLTLRSRSVRSLPLPGDDLCHQVQLGTGDQPGRLFDNRHLGDLPGNTEHIRLAHPGWSTDLPLTAITDDSLGASIGCGALDDPPLRLATRPRVRTPSRPRATRGGRGRCTARIGCHAVTSVLAWPHLQRFTVRSPTDVRQRVRMSGSARSSPVAPGLIIPELLVSGDDRDLCQGGCGRGR